MTALSSTLIYSSLSLTSFPDVPGSTQYLLRFGITGAAYAPNGPGTAYNINIPGAGRGDVLFLRNTDYVQFDTNGLLTGITTFDIRINTDTSGDGGTTFNVLKGSNTNYQLFYAVNGFSYSVGDVLDPVSIGITLGPQPGGPFTANLRATPTSFNRYTLSVTGAKYDGYDIPNSKVALPNAAALFLYQQTSGQTGVTSGPTASIQGTIITGMNYAGNGAFNAGGPGFIVPPNPITWDSSVNDNNKLYFTYTNNFNLGVPVTEFASNYLAAVPIILPLNNSPTTYTSSPAGITANIYNINYNFTGLTGGQILVRNTQSGTTAISNIIRNPITNLYYAPYFFSPVGATAIIEPGSYYQYINPANPSQLSGATFAIPSHVIGPEGITGTLDVNYRHSRTKTVLTLDNFDYFDGDKNSIFTVLGNTGQIYLTNRYSGNTGTLYSGITGIPFTGATASITYSNRGPYIVEFPDLGPTGATTIPYQLSTFAYNNGSGSLKSSKITIPVTFSALSAVPELINAAEIEKSISASVLYFKFNQFDYLNDYAYSIFGPSSVTGGTISLLNGSTTGPVIGSTAYQYSLGSNYNYVISATGTFSTTSITDTYLRFTPNGSTAYKTASKTVLFNPSPASEAFLGTIVPINLEPLPARFRLTNFDYIDSFGYSIFNSSRYASNPHIGSVELLDSNGIVVGSNSFTGSPTTQTFDFSIHETGPYTNYFVRFNDSTLNLVRTSIKRLMSTAGATGIIPYQELNAQGGTAFGYTGPADLQFPYVFTANAAQVTEITVLGELTKPLNFDQKIVLNVPRDELQRMLVYDSAWSGGQYGTGASGTGGFSGFSGTTHQNASGFTGPNVGLFLQYVLSKVNVLIPGGFTGHNGVSGQSDRLGGLDILFSDPIIRNYQTLGNSGQTGNPWGVTGGFTGYFTDDAGVTGPQISKYMDENNITGAGATFSSQSLLNFIPVEAIRSIRQAGLQIDKVSDIVRNVDTTMPIYVDPLRNLFEQSVAYSRVTDSNIYPLSIVPPGLTGPTSPWTTAAKIYGVDFNNGDSLTFYIRYAMGAVRRYGIDPTVVGGLDPIWQNAPAITLTFNGKTFDIPIGSSSAYSGLTGGGTTGGSDADTELSTGGQLRTLAVQLLASPNKSNFDY
jgi:hypothetical protein